jgi:hypothetical protein
MRFVYEDADSLWNKMKAIATQVYGASDISADSAVRARIARLQQEGYGHYPVCVAKTQYSFSTDPKLRGAPSGHMVNIRDVRLAAGAEFVVMICGDILTMPGLPKSRRPRASTSTTRGGFRACFNQQGQRMLWRRAQGASVFNPACGPGAVTSHPHLTPARSRRARARWRAISARARCAGAARRSGHVAVHHIDLVGRAAILRSQASSLVGVGVGRGRLELHHFGATSTSWPWMRVDFSPRQCGRRACPAPGSRSG